MRTIKFRAWDEENGMYPVEMLHFNKDGIHAPYVKEVMQYTGLKDRNGKEIYEGDVVGDTFAGVPELVTFEDGRFSTKKGFDLAKVEILGNIYENPELLK